MPAPSQLESWARSVPDGFRFSVKAHRALTYSGPAFDKRALAAEFTERLLPLGDRRGPILLQFPPTRERDDALLADVLGALRGRAALEFRHESWFAAPVYELGREHGACFVVTDEESWPMAPSVGDSRIAYFRLRRDYDQAQLEAWSRRIQEEASGRDEVHVYFKHFPRAPERALRVRELLDAPA